MVPLVNGEMRGAICIRALFFIIIYFWWTGFILGQMWMSRSLSVTILDFFLFFPEGSNLFDLLFLKKIIVDGFFFLKKLEL